MPKPSKGKAKLSKEAKLGKVMLSEEVRKAKRQTKC